MISWWWIPIFFIAGGTLGAAMMCLFIASREEEN
jgi:hypothetical protein